MSKHKWVQPRNWDDGPMSAPKRPVPSRCTECGVVVYDTFRFDLESRPCPELVTHIWFYHADNGEEKFKCACGAWTSDERPPRSACSLMFALRPNMHSGREVQIAPTVDASTSIERQALLDIVALIDGEYEDTYILKMVDQIAKKVLDNG